MSYSPNQSRSPVLEGCYVCIWPVQGTRKCQGCAGHMNILQVRLRKMTDRTCPAVEPLCVRTSSRHVSSSGSAVGILCRFSRTMRHNSRSASAHANLRARGLEMAVGEVICGETTGIRTSFRSRLYHQGGKHFFAHPRHLSLLGSLGHRMLRYKACNSRWLV